MAALLALIVAAPSDAGLRFVATRGADSALDVTGGFTDFIQVVADPGGANLYAVTGTIWVFARDAATGELTLLQEVKEGSGGVTGMNEANHLAISPDGRHAYIASAGSDAVTVFSRDQVTGVLTFIEKQQDGVGGVDGLDGAAAVWVSADGDNVYAAGSLDDVIAVFERNPVSGALTFLEMEKDGVGGVDGLNGAQSVTGSADGKHVYVGGFWASAVAVFARNATTGTLTFVEAEKDGVGGVDELAGTFAVSMSPDGEFVFATAMVDNALTVFSRDDNTGALSPVQVKKQGVGGVTAMYQPLGVTADGDRILHVLAATGSTTFSRDPNSGTLTLLRSLPSFDGRSLVIDGRHAYLGPAVTAAGVMRFSHNTATGELRYREAYSRTGEATGLAGVFDIAMSPLDAVWVTGGVFPDGVVSRFYRPATTGLLAFPTVHTDIPSPPLTSGSSIALSTFDTYLTSPSSASLTKYRWYPPVGIDTRYDDTGGVDGLSGAQSLLVSSDGLFIYVAGAYDQAISVFGTTEGGPLTFVEMQKQGVGGVDGLDLPRELALSPDGDFLYVTSVEGSSIAVFSRDPVSGSLTYLTVYRDGVGGVDGIDGVGSIAVSADGAHLYTTSFNDQAVTAFARNPGTGLLTYLAHTPGFHLWGALTVSPDGRWVYALSDAFAINLFEREASSGLLTLRYTGYDGIDGITGLAGAARLAVSSDGVYIYVTAPASNDIVIFTQSCGDLVLDSGEQCDDGNESDGDCCSATCQFEAASCSTILGRSFAVKDPRPGTDATKRVVVASGIETGSADVVSGNPTVTGAILEVAANGDGSTRESHFLPAARWTATATGFRYADPTGVDGPVKKVLVMKSGSGTFKLKATLSAKVHPVGVVPPNLGTDGGIKLTIPGGGTYCIRLGGPAGGLLSAARNTEKLFLLKGTASAPAVEASCP